MPPFQSRLFKWIYHSPPFQWGRRARYALHRWLQTLERFWQNTLSNLFTSQEKLSPNSPQAKLPPWRRFLAKQTSKITSSFRGLALPSTSIVPQQWRTLLEEAINYFLRRPKLSAREREYENESGHWPPLTPAADQITLINLEPEDPPLHAWIDTQATSLGYAYSPLTNFLLCLDRWVAALEKWILSLWRKFWNWLTTYKSA